MYMDYFLYLNTLLEVERNKQLLTILLIWLIMLIIATMIAIVEYKAKRKQSE